jgi:uncharacterized membrane protein YoaK (UPF0700 family)
MTAATPLQSASAISNQGFGADALGVAWLSFASGATDVLSFLVFGDVFTSAMTGNTALLAIAVGRGQFLAASRSLTALLGFALGVILAQALRDRGGPAQEPRRMLRRLLLLEIVCLCGSALLWSAARASLIGDVAYVVILLSAASMGIQGVAARVIGSAGINTIVFTTVLVSIFISLTATLAPRASRAAAPADIRTHLGTFAAYAAGALLASVLTIRAAALLVWLPVSAVAFALAASYLRRERERRAK